MELFRETHFDFLKYRWHAIVASWLLIIAGLIAVFVNKGLKFGIDFAGGTQIALRFAQRPDVDRLRALLEQAGLGETGIQRYEEESRNQVLIRVQQQAKEGDVTSQVLDALRRGLQEPIDPAKIDINAAGRDVLANRLSAADPDGPAARGETPAETYYARIAQTIVDRRGQLGVFSSPADVDATTASPAVKSWIKANAYAGPFVMLSAESVGPQVGKDLRSKALWAIGASIFGMLVYIALRFRSLPFGVGAIVALVHDTLITVGLLAILGREFNLVVVAALLTLVGYSVNDTVVVYDRVRENQRSPKKESLDAVINKSINQTLSRTILTAGATLLVCLALYFLGGDVLNTFALTLIIGIFIGTYSSIYVAASIVSIWNAWSRKRAKVAVVPVPAAPTAPEAKRKSGKR
ncbi:MAG TPA: protein translocase subunit SecF [Thermoanaerobaculia bacterium]